MKQLYWLIPLLVAVVAAPGHAAVAVDLELSLLLDVSGSISTSQFNLQVDGYSDAFDNPVIQNLIQSGTIGKMAANMVMWSSSGQQSQVVGWTLIEDQTTSEAFADAIDAVVRPFNGNTAPQNAMSFATPLFASNDFDGTRSVIDISGDGEANSGDTSGTSGRDAALAAGITVNGLVIGTDPAVLNYYTNSVIGGPNAFVVQVDDFGDFAAAISEKLEKEIPPPPDIPEPASIFVFAGLGLAAALFRRGRRAA